LIHPIAAALRRFPMVGVNSRFLTDLVHAAFASAALWTWILLIASMM